MKKNFTLQLMMLIILYLPVQLSAATFTATTSGAWTSSATWGNAGVPTTGDIAIIPAGITVTYLQNTANNWGGYSHVFGFYNPGRIDIYGILKISSSTTDLVFEFINAVTINIYSGGEFQNDLTTTIIGFNGKTSSINGYMGAKITLGSNPVNTNSYTDMDLAISYVVYVQYNINGGGYPPPSPTAFVRPEPVTNNTFQLLTSASNITFTTGVTSLPIKLAFFRGQTTSAGNQLWWRSTLEQDALEYQLERSVDGIHFQKIATIPVVGVPSDYRYLDPAIPLGYYRLKLVDIDKSFQYSQIVRLAAKPAAADFRVFPNPANSMLEIRTDIQKAALKLMDLTGKVLYASAWKQGDRIVLKDSWKGLIMVELTHEGMRYQQKVIVQ